MSLVSVFRNKNKIYCMSDSSSKMFFKVGCCYVPEATKIYVYEDKYVIQNCGLGTIGGKFTHDRIVDFATKNPGKSIDELPKLLLEYFKQFKNCGEAQKFDSFDLILLVSGWEDSISKIYEIKTIDESITLVTDDLIADGIETTAYKKQFTFLNKVLENPLLSMKLSFAFITNALKCLDYLEKDEPITSEKIKEIFEQHPELNDECTAVDKPYDSVILEKNGDKTIDISAKE